jgi:hypothetical protein
MVGTLAGAAEEFRRYPIQVIAALLAIAGAASVAFKRVREFWRRQWACVRSRAFIPRETLRIVQKVEGSHWGVGAFAGKPAMQVVFDGCVTNITGRRNRVVRAEIPKTVTRVNIVMLYENSVGMRRRDETLGPFENSNIHVMLTVEPVVGKAGEAWKSAIVFIDQYNNRHKVKRCVFRGLRPPPAVKMGQVGM